MLKRLISGIRQVYSHPLNSGNFSKALSRYLRWQISSRLACGPIIIPWVNSSKFIARPGETGITGNVFNGLQEFQDMAFLLHAIRRNEFFYDVGANSGSYTILACGAIGARAISIEPIPSTFERLLLNIHLNNLSNHVRALNIGISDSLGFLQFSDKDDTTNRVIEGKNGTSGMKIEVATLDSISENESPSIMKIDVEGYELPALRGASRLLSKPELHSVILEINGSSEKYGFDEREITKLMAKNGYDIFSYDPRKRELKHLNYPNKVGNTLFIKNEAMVSKLVSSSPPFALNGMEI